MLKVLWNRLKKDEQGFTMVELLVVIVILGVLAGIGIPSYRSFITRSHEAATLAELQAVSMAVKFYGVENNNARPSEVSDLERYIGDDFIGEKFLGTYELDFEEDYILAEIGEANDRIDARIYLETTDGHRLGDIVFDFE